MISLSFFIFYIWILYVYYHSQTASRKLLLDVLPTVLNNVTVLSKSSAATRSPLLRKYLIKLTQRIGLVCLPHRLPSWRYVVRTF